MTGDLHDPDRWAQLEARDHQDHGLLDLDLDDPRVTRSNEVAGRLARQHPDYPAWTPSKDDHV